MTLAAGNLASGAAHVTPQVALADLELRVNGPQTIEEVLSEVTLREVERRGAEKGKQELLDEIGQQVTTRVNSYISSLFEVAAAVKIAASKRLVKVKVVDYRTFLLPFSDDMHLFLLVNADSAEDDIEFGRVIADVERSMLMEHNIFCEVLYARTNPHLDVSSVKRDYPFSLRL